MYTSDYGDVVEHAAAMVETPPNLTITELMKHGRMTGKTENDSAGSANCLPEKKQWLPLDLDAKVYLLADKYKICQLKEKAASEMEMMLDSTEYITPYFLAVLAEIFRIDVNQDGVHVKLENQEGNDTTVPLLTTATPGEVSGLPPSSPISLSEPPHDFRFSPKTDYKLWNLLADELVTHFADLTSNPIVEEALKKHPTFQFDVLKRLQSKFQESKAELERKSQEVSELAAQKPGKAKPKLESKPKTQTPRKRKAKEMSIDTVSEN
jgi:hypothetical protein